MRTKKKTAIEWLFPESRKKVLALLLGEPSQKWYLRDIARRTGCALGTVRRELAGLVRADIVIKTTDGNRTYYQSNTDCPFFPELSGLLRKTAGLVDVLRAALRPVSNKVEVAFVYGSVAEGNARGGSDVDLMVVGSCGFGEVVDAIHGAQEGIGREINPSVYGTEEFRSKITSKHHFLTTVLNGPKIFLIGDESELRRLAQ